MRTAGGGGGPPRKSHTKSRKGCRICKTRHIRCDETFPQCRNCSKHSVRCDYMDVAKAGDEPIKGANAPELLPSPQLRDALDNWRITGEPPVAELRTSDPSYWTQFPAVDLRLVQHITTLSSDLYRRGYSACIPFTMKMSSLICVALSSDYVMSALLAVSASHLAWQTGNYDIEQLASHHQNISTKGLHEALTAFSDRNAETVLAASILLSWQAKDWQSWKLLQHGITSVLDIVRPWVRHSEMAQYLEAQTCLSRARHNSEMSAAGVGHSQPTAEELDKLPQIYDALQNLRLRLSSFPDHMKQHIDIALDLVRKVQTEFPIHDPNRQFELLQNIRALVFWTPTSILRPEESDLGAFSIMAHIYAFAIAVEPLFPACQGLHLGNTALEPLENICQTLQARAATMQQDTALQTALSMLEAPSQIAQAYRSNSRAGFQQAHLYRHPSQMSSMQMPMYNSPTYSAHDTQRQQQQQQQQQQPQQQSQSYSAVGMQSPYTEYAPNLSYIGYPSSVSTRTDSISSRAHSQPRLSTSSSIPSLASPQSIHSDTLPNPNEYYASNVSYTSSPGHGNIHHYTSHSQNRLVSPHIQASVWT